MKCAKCDSYNTIRNGWYHTKIHSVQKYFCKDCEGDFTELTATTEEGTKQSHKPELDEEIYELRDQGYSIRLIADMLNCAPKTVLRKLKKLEG